jgi:isopropylmalate/homocitrate/citramalate synthase
MKKPWKSEKWYVSYMNFLDEVRANFKIPKRVMIDDITLRDGEQQAGLVFNKKDKVKIATLLDEVGVDRIEAGMPAVSNQDKEAVRAIARSGLHAKVFSFSRCMKRDVDLALDCDVDGIAMEIPSSEQIIRYAYAWPLEKAIDLSIEATSYAAQHGLYVSFFTIDSTRASLEWWFRIIDNVSRKGHMDSIVLVDTFGVCTPEAIKYFTKKAREHINKPIEAHFHNDFGLATANSLAAVTEGAEVVHTTVNGIGERMGNADLAETALALEALYGVKLNIKFSKLRELSKLVEKVSGVKMPPHKAVVGDNIFKVESGIVSGWWLNLRRVKRPLVMYPYAWDFVGQEGVELVLGKKSGRESVISKLKELGVDPSKVDVDKLLLLIKEESLKRKSLVSDDDLKKLLKKLQTEN